MRTTLLYILLTALRDRLFAGLFLAVLLSAMLSYFLGSTALIEQQAMALSFASAATRIILDMGLIIFTCFHLRRGFEHKEIDVMLSRPISRVEFVLAYWMGLALVAAILVIPSILLIGAMGGFHSNGFVFWGTSLLVEAWLMVAMALFIGLILRSAVSAVIACFGFYALARMMAFFVLMAANHATLFHEAWLNALSRNAVSTISMLLPRLDLFAKSEWLVYGLPQADGQGHWLFLAQGAVYIAFLLAASIFDFRRKQF